jgi:hypothetical protein
MRRTLALLCLLVVAAPAARAYEAASTHAGMTERAALHEGLLHRYLRQAHGLPLGMYEPIRLDVTRLPRAAGAELRIQLGELDPMHGYRPDPRGFNRAAGWLAAGSVLEEMPFSRGRHHFLNPFTRRGLANATGRWGLSMRMRFWDLQEGDGNLSGLFTGANFGLTGDSALHWLRSRWNGYSLDRLAARLARAFAAAQPDERKHALAQALVNLGAVLHVVQDMAVPAHVRNDFVGAYLQRRSSIDSDRTSEYETLVLASYGRAGIPAVSGPLPVQPTVEAFLTNAQGTGLADRTARRFFSTGSLPRALKLRRPSSALRIAERVNRSLRLPEPRVEGLDLRGASRGGRYLGSMTTPHLVAYRISPEGTLEFALDARCHRAAAKELVPEAVRVSAAVLRHLLRGSLRLERQGDALVVRHDGGTLGKGTLVVLAEDARGQRSALLTVETAGPVAAGALVAALPTGPVPRGARLWAVWTGISSQGEPWTIGSPLTIP